MLTSYQNRPELRIEKRKPNGSRPQAKREDQVTAENPGSDFYAFPEHRKQPDVEWEIDCWPQA